MRLLLAVLAFLGISFGTPPVSVVPEPTQTATPASDSQRTVTVERITYAYVTTGPVEASRVTLFSNLPAKRSTTELIDTHSCKALTSGGFYDTNDQPIGLFEVNDGILHPASPNSLFNGFVWATMAHTSGIGVETPDEAKKFALQTGPLLIENGKPRTLKLKADQSARRIIVETGNDNTFIFVAIHSESSEFSGPELVMLPEILAAINKQEEFDITDAINLDGGNHSAFISQEDTLIELSPVGSIFCIR